MLTLRVYSDIHQETDAKQATPFQIAELPGEADQILVLAGDIIALRHLDRYMAYFADLSRRFRTVLYVFGNHEFYGYTLGHKYLKRVEAKLATFSNLHIISRHTPSVELQGLRVVGAPLWTDLDRQYADPLRSNDFFRIKYQEGSRYSKFRPSLWATEHRRDMAWLVDQLQGTERAIVLTHHAPSRQSLDPDDPTGEFAAFYRTELDDFIERHPEICLWLHGHIHTPFDFVVGATRIFANPIGYEAIHDTNPQGSLVHLD